MKAGATAIILAGGKSSRMEGKDKAMLPVNGVPLIQYISAQLTPLFSEILIGANDEQKYAFLGFPVIPDLEPGRGPLMGLLSCLRASRHDINFVTACDIPVMNIALIREMIQLSKEYPIVMPRHGESFYEPLFAVYRREVAEHALELLASGKSGVIDLMPHVAVKLVETDPATWYRNLNSPDDFNDFEKAVW